MIRFGPLRAFLLGPNLLLLEEENQRLLSHNRYLTDELDKLTTIVSDLTRSLTQEKAKLTQARSEAKSALRDVTPQEKERAQRFRKALLVIYKAYKKGTPQDLRIAILEGRQLIGGPKLVTPVNPNTNSNTKDR